MKYLNLCSSLPSQPKVFYFISTCFWGVDILVPKLLVKNQHHEQVPIQQFLQTASLDMWDMVVRAIGDLEAVIGVEVSLFFLLV